MPLPLGEADARSASGEGLSHGKSCDPHPRFAPYLYRCALSRLHSLRSCLSPGEGLSSKKRLYVQSRAEHTIPVDETERVQPTLTIIDDTLRMSACWHTG